MSDEAYLSNVIVTRPNLNPGTNPGYLSLYGTVSAQDCEFNFAGSFSTGYFSLGESGYCTHSGIVVPLVNRELSSISYDNNVDQNITYASTPSKSKLTNFKRDMGERKKKLLAKMANNQKETKRKSLKNAYRALASSLDYKMEETTRSNTFRSTKSVNLKKIQLEKEQIKNKYRKK